MRIFGWVAALTIIGMITAGAIAAMPSTFRIVHGWPDMPAGRVLGSAAGVGVNSKGEVFVFHRAGRLWSEPLPLEPITSPTIAVFDGRTGKFLREWGQNLVAMPHGLTVDSKDNIWITDVALHQVLKFSPEGKLLLTLGERGIAGNDPLHFDRPTDVAVRPDGSFYVSDGYRNTRIARFSAEGKFVYQWGRPGTGPGEFDTPHAIALDEVGQVYVADRQNDRVQVFDGKGQFIKQFKDPQIGRPYSVTLLSGGYAVIADGGEQPETGPDRSGVSITNGQGRVLQRIGRYGNYDGQFRMAHDVATDRSGNIYVVDIAGQRVQKFAPGR